MRLKMEVSLDNAEAAEYVENSSSPRDAFAYVVARCRVLDSGRIKDGNGNTIGRVEVTE